MVGLLSYLHSGQNTRSDWKRCLQHHAECLKRISSLENKSSFLFYLHPLDSTIEPEDEHTWFNGSENFKLFAKTNVTRDHGTGAAIASAQNSSYNRDWSVMENGSFIWSSGVTHTSTELFDSLCSLFVTPFWVLLSLFETSPEKENLTNTLKNQMPSTCPLCRLVCEGGCDGVCEGFRGGILNVGFVFFNKFAQIYILKKGSFRTKLSKQFSKKSPWRHVQ